MSIVVNSLTYIHPDGGMLFNNISFAIQSGDKVSLVGNNGVGKSTILRIITGDLQQTQGDIIISERPFYIPQHLGQFDNLSVLEALQIDNKINALHAILNGDVSQQNLDILNDDWDIEERVNATLKQWHIEYVNPSKKMLYLSGGEKTKVFLAGISIHSSSLILLDEPSNHLDLKSRSILYDLIKNSNSTILSVSHDRDFLNLVNKTIELTTSSAEIYGGNYDFYKEEKMRKMNSLQTQLADKENRLKKEQQKSREIAERRQKQETRGKGQKAKAGIPRIVMGGLKNNAERSSAKIKGEQIEKINETYAEINSIKQQIKSEQSLNINIKNSDLHRDKILVSADSINIIYEDIPLWRKHLSFQIYSGDRIQIKGDNGTGKTSLVKLITNEKQISAGQIAIADYKYLYIDQEYSIIENNATVFEQVLKFNDQCLLEHDLKMHLYHHQFSLEYWVRQCESLSGGEKMKLLLCCLAISNNTPDMLILDEPTNNLDINSQNILTYAIKEFKGTILVISHDNYFINKIGINKVITL